MQAKSGIAEHSWSYGHSIHWEGVEILDRASNKMKLPLLKEAVRIHLTPKDRHIKQDRHFQIQESWNWTLKRGPHYHRHCQPLVL